MIDLVSVADEARTGSVVAWTRLHRELAPSMMRYLLAHGVDDAGALLGDVLVDLARALPRFHGDETALRTSIFRFAHLRLADGGYPPASSSMPLERVLDAASRQVAGPDSARGAVISARMRRRFRMMSEPTQEALLLHVFGQLSAEEAQRAIGGPLRAGRHHGPVRFSHTGTAVTEAAAALVRDLPPPPTGHLESRHVEEAAASARFVAPADGFVPDVSPTPATAVRRRHPGRVSGSLLLTLVLVAAVTGVLADGIEAASGAALRGLEQAVRRGGQAASARLKEGDRRAGRSMGACAVDASPQVAGPAEPPHAAASDPASSASSGAGDSSAVPGDVTHPRAAPPPPAGPRPAPAPDAGQPPEQEERRGKDSDSRKRPPIAEPQDGDEREDHGDRDDEEGEHEGDDDGDD